MLFSIDAVTAGSTLYRRLPRFLQPDLDRDEVVARVRLRGDGRIVDLARAAVDDSRDDAAGLRAAQDLPRPSGRHGLVERSLAGLFPCVILKTAGLLAGQGVNVNELSFVSSATSKKIRPVTN